jgi:hypothetical protein
MVLRLKASAADERILSMSSPSIYPPDHVKTVSRPRYRDLTARRKERRRKTDLAIPNITILVLLATNPPALGPTTAKKKIRRNPPIPHCPHLQYQHKEIKTRTNLNGKPEIGSVCSRKRSELRGWLE